jgi:hypothetical protein
VFTNRIGVVRKQRRKSHPIFSWLTIRKIYNFRGNQP